MTEPTTLDRMQAASKRLEPLLPLQFATAEDLWWLLLYLDAMIEPCGDSNEARDFRRRRLQHLLQQIREQCSEGLLPYPVCVPAVGTQVCERCGGPVGVGPCPAVRSERWDIRHEGDT